MKRSAEFSHYSRLMKDNYQILTHLPDSYDATDNQYPVLYVLDADRCFGLVSDTCDWLAWAKEIPEVILVGAAYGGSLESWWQKRSRDYCPTYDRARAWGDWPLAGGAKVYQDSLYEELFPMISGRYRVLANDGAVFGLSLGGLFGAFTLFTRPELFRKNILVAPPLGWDRGNMREYEKQYRARSRTRPAIVFAAVGDRDHPLILDSSKYMDAYFAENPYVRLRWHYHVFKDETHISVLPGALSRGLKTVYSGGT